MKAYIVDGVYTPRASVRKGQSAYSEVHPQELLATCLKSLQDRQPETVRQADAIYIGCVTQVNDQGANIARNAMLAAGLPESIAALSLNMCCGSGLQAINLAASVVDSGAASLVVAGGVESMSRVTMGSDGGGLDGNNAHLRHILQQIPQGISADAIATQDGITREELDLYSLHSHQKASKAREGGYFKTSYALIRGEDGQILLPEDNHVRPDTSLEALGALPSAFTKVTEQLISNGTIGKDGVLSAINHFHTAGNSSGIADGAALMMVAGETFIKTHYIKARAIIRGVAARGSDPILMLTGPAQCCEDVLRSCGMSTKDVDLWEINEAFAVVPIQTSRRLKIDNEKINVNGGAIALGHPLGATGAILLTSLVSELERRNLAIGCAVLCVAGGQSVATVIERC